MKARSLVRLDHIVGVMLCIFTLNVLAEDYCSDVLRLAGTNYSLRIYELSIAKNTYDNFCSGKEVKSGTDFTAGLDAIIKAVPIKFNLGYGSTRERAEYFCSTYFDDFKQNEHEFEETHTVVEQAVNAWSSCMALAANGVTFKPYVTPTQAHIEVTRLSAESAQVQGVHYDNKLLDCSVPNSNGSSKRQRAGPSTIKTLSSNSWTLTCKRIPQPTNSGEMLYGQADLSVVTSKGTYLLPIGAVARFPYQFSDQIQSELANLSEDVTMSNQAFNAIFEKMRSNASPTYIGEENESGFHGHTFECPKNQYVAGLQPFDNDGGRYCTGCLTGVKVLCKPLPL